MSKTLVERLCQWAKADGAGIWGEAADRIKELERVREHDLEQEQVLLKRIEELEAQIKLCGMPAVESADHIVDLRSRIKAGLELADEMEERNYSGTMDWYAEQLREALGGGDE